jgi:hypothetical protein
LFYLNGGNSLTLGWTTDGDNGATFASTSTSWTPSTSTWYHVAVTREGNDVHFFVDGVWLATNTVTATFFDGTAALVVGGHPVGGQDFNGHIDEVRIVKGTALYSPNFTPPTEAFPTTTGVVLLANFDDADGDTTYTSEDTRLRTATFVANAQLDTAQAKFGATSLLLDGTGDYLTFPQSTDFDFDALGRWAGTQRVDSESIIQRTELVTAPFMTQPQHSPLLLVSGITLLHRVKALLYGSL